MLSAFVLVLTLSTTYPPCNEEQLAYYEAKGWDAYECAADMANLPMEQDDRDDSLQPDEEHLREEPYP